jgi:hypothetical protein
MISKSEKKNTNETANVCRKNVLQHNLTFSQECAGIKGDLPKLNAVPKERMGFGECSYTKILPKKLNF